MQLKLKFKTAADAYKAYRYLSLGYELGILPKLEFQYEGNKPYLVVGT